MTLLAQCRSLVNERDAAAVHDRCGVSDREGQVDEVVRRQGDEITAHLQGRAVRAVRRWQDEGLACPDLDPVLTAHALTYMVERVAMAWMSGRADYDEDAMVEAINLIWERSLGLGIDHAAGPSPRG